jgi:hypothetical protein
VDFGDLYMYHAISLSKQLEYYREYERRVVEIAGKSNASTIIFGAVYFLSAGNSDFLQNYYIDPLLHAVYSFDGFSHILMQSYTNFIQVPPDLLTARSPFCLFF